MRTLLFFLFAAVTVTTHAVETDDFVSLPPAFKAKDGLERFNPSVAVSDQNEIILSNRGAVISKDSYSNSAKLSFRWMWTEGQEKDAYQDVLTVMFRTEADKRSTEWTFEFSHGLAVLLEAHDGSVTIRHFDPAGNKLLAKEKVDQLRGVPIPVVITDDGKTITVNVAGKQLKANVPALPGGKIAIYNREPVAGVRKTSVLSSIELKR